MNNCPLFLFLKNGLNYNQNSFKMMNVFELIAWSNAIVKNDGDFGSSHVRCQELLKVADSGTRIAIEWIAHCGRNKF